MDIFFLLMHVLPRCGLKIKTTPKDKETTDASKVKKGVERSCLLLFPCLLNTVYEGCWRSYSGMVSSAYIQVTGLGPKFLDRIPEQYCRQKNIVIMHATTNIKDIVSYCAHQSIF